MEIVIGPSKTVPKADEPSAAQGAGGMAEVIGELPEFARLLATPRQELALHVHDQQLVCSDCGESWPCERAALAAFTLGAL